MTTRLSLIVIRAENPQNLARFYEILGLSFLAEKHGDGPIHYAADLNGVVFEIYPRSAKSGDTSDMRLGFGVDDVDAVWQQALIAGAKGLTPPEPSPWGYRAVLKDPEGHVVELSERK
jgi:predicted enzyme related to lactoylglutathione lyase